MNNNKRCLNCNQPLSNKFCPHCGQEDTDINLTFSELVRDFMGDMFTYDSRFYRTMFPLMFKPGFLSKEFYLGRRIRYVPPLRLYLFISFILFLWLALVDTVTLGDPPNQDVLIENKDRVLSEMEADGSPDWVISLVDQLMNASGKVMENPAAFLDVLSSRLPYLMFILLPIFAIILWLHYCFSGLGYLRHLIMAFHFHAFVYTLILVSSIINQIIGWENTWLIFFAVNIYIALALRRAYGSRKTACVFKTISILSCYFLTLALGFSAFLFVNVLGYA